MTDDFADPLAFEEDAPGDRDLIDRLVLDLDGFEGPIDVLLTLAREQKVDLARISILALAEQFLAFIGSARKHKLELAADYLVMAAWLAYLKSRLLLPEAKSADDEPTGAEMAAALAYQLQRLEAMQTAGKALMARARLGRDVHARGAPEGVEVVRHAVFDVTLYDMLRAYGAFKRRSQASVMAIEPFELYSMDAALARLESMLGKVPGWETLAGFLPRGLKGALLNRSAMASTFTAALELCRQGKAELRQDGGPFTALLVRRSR